MKIANKKKFKNFDSFGELVWVITAYIFAFSFIVALLSGFISVFTQSALAFLLFFFLIPVWSISLFYTGMMADNYIDTEENFGKKIKQKNENDIDWVVLILGLALVVGFSILLGWGFFTLVAKSFGLLVVFGLIAVLLIIIGMAIGMAIGISISHKRNVKRRL